MKLVMIGTGAIHVSSLPVYLRQLAATPDVDVEVVLTQAATSLVSPRALLHYCAGVHTDREESIVGRPAHVWLSEWADLVAVLPASAEFLGRLAAGLCNDLASLVAMSAVGRTSVWPSMNQTLYASPAVARNLRTLADDGYDVRMCEDGSDLTPDPMAFLEYVIVGGASMR